MSENDKGWTGNFFEDFEVGQHIACPTPRQITSGEVASYIALTGDRTPRYCGSAGRVHPLIVFHTVMGQTVRHISLNARANLGYAGMTFRRPVRLGATLSTSVEIIGLKENSNKKTGIVWVKTTGRDDDGERVLDYVRWVMVKKRGEAATRWLDEPVVPELPAAVAPTELKLDKSGEPPQRTVTGADWHFEDYAVGERVFHHDGQTVNPSDHMAFTRLFQNSAKVHFDALLTGGKPLVYGGYPMSLGYAQAFNGFENRMGIAAINGGAHSNPVYAGDTLYAFTEVVDAAELDTRYGALRCHLYVVKNENPVETGGGFQVNGEDGKYHPSVVLDLDFWEIVPRRTSA
jgi:2-methylfumaryl-CoA hydratase